MNSATLPVWAELIIAALLLCGAGVALLGSMGLLRLSHFFERVHAPAMISTLGCWCIVAAALLHSYVGTGTWAVHMVLIAIFMAITVPITTIFLMRAGLFRARQAGRKDIPPTLSRIIHSGPQKPNTPQ